MSRYRPSRTARPTMHDLTPERTLQAAQREAASLLGYYYWHIPDSRQVDAGWPDTVLLGPRLSATPGLWLLENKTEAGRLTTVQADVLAVLERVQTPPVSRVVRPSTWGAMLDELQRRTR